MLVLVSVLGVSVLLVGWYWWVGSGGERLCWRRPFVWAAGGWFYRLQGRAGSQDTPRTPAGGSRLRVRIEYAPFRR